MNDPCISAVCFALHNISPIKREDGDRMKTEISPLLSKYIALPPYAVSPTALVNELIISILSFWKYINRQNTLKLQTPLQLFD